MIIYAFIVSITSTASLASDELEPLYTDPWSLTYEDLIVDIQGYKVPSLVAFKGWALLNKNEKRLIEIKEQFLAAGIKETMPLYLVLLQGTDWTHTKSTLFTLPDDKNIPKMINTIRFIQTYIEPEIGLVIPVSGERTAEYNQEAGGASQSKHLSFCALDVVPKDSIDRTVLHEKLLHIFNTVGKKYNVGLGLYSGVRFHIDTCGFRQW
ncbi:hypothetical protein BCU68_04265 [Vibrio sp. 10N.286.49.B3]|nr:hypothetical protein BCU68_04265 [Vibrio sp. 10N.286.49.B3]